MPDLDFVFAPIITYHNLTHSLTFWALLCVILILIKRPKGLPYVVSILSHFLIGDIITGNPTFYGLTNQRFRNFRMNIASQFGEAYGMLYQATVDANMDRLLDT
jgi:hypothetical protein